jgi:hypothetical protein
MGHSRKHPYVPHRGNWKLNPSTPLGCDLIHLLQDYQKQFFSLANFLLGGNLDLFWNDLYV